MRNRLLLLVVIVLAALTTACPNQGGEGKGADQAETPEPKAMVIKANPISTLEKMVNAINARDIAAYNLLIHPESPDRDKLTMRFEQFGGGRMALEDVSLQSQEGTEAKISYDFATTFDDGATEPAFETGTAILHFLDEQWLIWELQIRTGGPS